MENDIFKAGVRPGGPTSHDEIKMLICYMLSNVSESMSFAMLHEALLEHNLVNYFELVQVIDGLVFSGHLSVEESESADLYAVTALGRQAGREFENSLPLTVRQKAVRAADKLLRRRKREAEVQIDVRKADGGYLMELAIPEAGDSLISFTLFLPTREECELVRRRFLNDPIFIYKGVMALLSGDRAVLGDIFPEPDPLFD